MTTTDPLLQVQDLKKHFPIRQGLFRREIDNIRAVDGLTFDIQRGQTLALVGEKGSGKSTTGRAILQLIRPTSGRVIFNGQDLTELSERNLRQLRRHLQIIFHDPYTALNPRLSIGRILEEPLTIHPTANQGQNRQQRIADLLALVGLNPYYAGRYPHEFTGLQRQRLNLARALATNPAFLVADEPTAALDPVVAPQFTALLAEVKQQLDLTYLLLSADLATIQSISDLIAILYLGRMVEYTGRDTLLTQPLHPYTQTLISTLPLSDPTHEARRQPLSSRSTLHAPHATLHATPPACRFQPHCPYATDLCRHTTPPLRDLGSPTHPHLVACHHAEQFSRTTNY